jgi:hypothetical protein
MPTPRRLTKQALSEELLDTKTMGIRQRGDYGTGVTPSVGQVAVKLSSDQLMAGSSEPADSLGISSVQRGGIYR